MKKINPFLSKKTPLRPSIFGKQERRARIGTKLTIQLFKPSTNVDRIIATMAVNGTVSFFLLKAMHVANSKTNNSSSALRPILLSIPLDPKEYEAGKNGNGATRIVYNNSAPEMAKLLFSPKSPFNSAFVTGSIASQYIPHYISDKEHPELNWDNRVHNNHAKVLAAELTALDSKNLTDADKAKAYETHWNNYQAAEKALIAKGILVANMIVVVDNEGLVPAVSINQESSSSNQYLDAKAVFGNENSTATYAPLLNQVHSIVDISDAAFDTNSDWVYGLNSLSPEGSARNIQATSTEVYGYDFTNQKAALPMRVVVSDSYTNMNAKPGETRSERFLEFCEENTQAEISNAELSLGFATGGLTSIFSIGGDNITYKAYTPAGANQDAINLNLDKEVELDLGDLISVSDISLEMDSSEEVALDNGVSDFDITDSASEF